MKTFVDILGIIILLTREEHASLFGKDNALFIYDKDAHAWTVKGFKNCGLRTELKSVDLSPEKTNQTTGDSLYELRFEVTLAKLLDKSRNIGGLTTRSEIEDACKKLNKIIRNIEKTSGVNLLQKAILSWVDLAKDVMTPNEFYSREIIKAANNALDIFGYQKDNSLTGDFEGDGNCVWFSCDNVSGEFYNKKQDLLDDMCDSVLETLGRFGLLCFKLTISADILKKDYSIESFIRLDSLPETLYQLTMDGNALLNKYFGSVFYGGAMLSRKVLKKYLKANCEMGQEKIKSMVDFSDWIRVMGSADLVYYGTYEQICSQMKEFEKLKISPVRVSKRCPYIPSFSDLINDTVDDKLLSFAWEATLYKDDLTYWNFDEISKSGKK